MIPRMAGSLRGKPDASSGTGRSAVYHGGMKLGDIGNPDAQQYPRPLDGIRVLAIEQMQALPYATQLLARMGADVVKVEPLSGDLGRASLPAMSDPAGRSVGATFLRNNLNKRSLCVDLKQAEGRQL